MFSAIFSSANKPNLSDLHAFVLIAELRSFRQAADRLGVTPSSLSHAMRGLEQCLNSKLLHRTTRSVSLTEAGQRFLHSLVPLLQDLDVVLGEVADAHGKTSGTLRINGGELAIDFLLERFVPAFLSRYPHVELDLVADGKLVDIVADGFDAGVRLGESVPKDMVAIRLSADQRFLPVAAPSYLENKTVPETPEMLMGHQCIRHRFPSGKRYRWEFSKHGQHMAIDVPGSLTLDSLRLMANAALAGLGVAYLPERLVAKALQQGRLVPLLEDWCPHTSGFYLYFPQSRHISSNLRAFIDVVRSMNDLDVRLQK